MELHRQNYNLINLLHHRPTSTKSAGNAATANDETPQTAEESQESRLLWALVGFLAVIDRMLRRAGALRASQGPCDLELARIIRHYVCEHAEHVQAKG